jgi:hypothetical protein
MGFSGEAVCTGIFSAAAAVGIHQQGKQSFKYNNTDLDEDIENLKKNKSTKVTNEKEAKG